MYNPAPVSPGLSAVSQQWYSPLLVMEHKLKRLATDDDSRARGAVPSSVVFSTMMTSWSLIPRCICTDWMNVGVLPHPHSSYDFSSCFFPKFKKSAKGRFSRGNDLFFSFLRPQNRGGGVPPTRLLSKNIKNPEIWPILGYFCLLWAGPAEQCCTPVYLPIEDFRQKLPFCWDSLAPKYGWGGSSHPSFLLNHQKPWNSAYFGVLLSVVGWCYRTVLHTSVPVSYSIGTKIP